MTHTPAPFSHETEGRMTKGANGIWGCSFLPFMINGFRYKEGYEYELLIRQTKIKPDPKIMDQPSYLYTLIEVISMTLVNVAEE